MEGEKHDTGKLRWDLLHYDAIEEVVRVLTYGAQKYDDENWKKVPGLRRRYFAAAMRHLTKWWMGEKNDPESGLHHLAHASCCIMFLMWKKPTPEEEMVEAVEKEMKRRGLK